MDDSLDLLAEEINSAKWDDANEIANYSASALANYLNQQDTIFLACHERVTDRRVLLGIASARVQPKPYGDERWLYVDEVDVCVDHRRRGVGKAMMKKFVELASEAGCDEIWLGTEVDNHAANALYRALDPDDVAQVVGYTYEITDND